MGLNIPGRVLSRLVRQGCDNPSLAGVRFIFGLDEDLWNRSMSSCHGDLAALEPVFELGDAACSSQGDSGLARRADGGGNLGGSRSCRCKRREVEGFVGPRLAAGDLSFPSSPREEKAWGES